MTVFIQSNAPIRSVALPPDCQYIIDSALGENHLTPFHAGALSLFGDIATIMRIVDQERLSGRGWMARTGAMLRELASHAEAVARDLPAAVQRTLVASALVVDPKIITGYAEILSHQRYEDQTVGGCLERYRRRHRCDDRFIAYPRLMAKISSARDIRRHVGRDIEMIPHGRFMRERLPTFAWPHSPTDAMDMIFWMVNQGRRHLALVREQRAEMIRKYDAKRQKADAPKPRLSQHQRNVIKRSSAAASAIIGSSMTDAFNRGDAVKLSDQDLVFDIRRTAEITSSGHGGMQVTLLDGKSGDQLAGLCIFFEDMPVFDQLAAVGLHIQGGEAVELIRAGNLYGVTSAGARHPLISAKLAERTKSRRAWGSMGFHAEDRWAALTGYLARTGAIYEDAIWRQFWGRSAGRARRFAEIAASASTEAQDAFDVQALTLGPNLSSMHQRPQDCPGRAV